MLQILIVKLAKRIRGRFLSRSWRFLLDVVRAMVIKLEMSNKLINNSSEEDKFNLCYPNCEIKPLEQAPPSGTFSSFQFAGPAQGFRGHRPILVMGSIVDSSNHKK